MRADVQRRQVIWMMDGDWEALIEIVRSRLHSVANLWARKVLTAGWIADVKLGLQCRADGGLEETTLRSSPWIP